MRKRVWRVAGASVRGVSHERTNAPCQDASAWAFSGRDFFIAAVADGAGSARLAEAGARLAASSSVAYLKTNLAGTLLGYDTPGESSCDLLAGAGARALEALNAESRKREVPVGDLATTLLLLMASARGLAAFQIGDGAVIWADGADAFHAPARVTSGEYLNETVFLTSTDALKNGQRTIWAGDLKHVALLSDGLQMAALRMPDAHPHPGFFKPLFDFVAHEKNTAQANRDLSEFLNSPRIRQRCDDDLTLVLATRLAL